MDKFEELQEQFKIISSDHDLLSRRRQEIIDFLDKANNLYGTSSEVNNYIDDKMKNIIPLIEEINRQSEIVKEKAEVWKKTSDNY